MIYINILMFFIILCISFFYLWMSESSKLEDEKRENKELKDKLALAEKNNMFLSGYISRVEENIIEQNIKNNLINSYSIEKKAKK